METSNQSTSDKNMLDRQLMPPPSSLPLPLLLKRKKQKDDVKVKSLEQPSNPESLDNFSSVDTFKAPSENTAEDAFTTFLSEIDTIVHQKSSTATTNDADASWARLDSKSTTEFAATSVWKEVLDPATRRLYYWNIETNEVTWFKPNDTVQGTAGLTKVVEQDVVPSLSTKLERNVEDKKQEENMTLKSSDLPSMSVYSQEDAVKNRVAASSKQSSKVSNTTRKIAEFMKQLDVLTDLCDHPKSDEAVAVVEEQQLETAPVAHNNGASNSFTSSLIADDRRNVIKNVLSGGAVSVSELIEEDKSKETESLSKCTQLLEEDELLQDILEAELGEFYTSTMQMDDSFRANVEQKEELVGGLKPQEVENMQIQGLLLDIYNKFSILPSQIDFMWKFAFKVQLETRMADWAAGELTGYYFTRVLTEAANTLSALVYSEQEASHVDSSALAAAYALHPHSSPPMQYGSLNDYLSLAPVYNTVVTSSTNVSHQQAPDCIQLHSNALAVSESLYKSDAPSRGTLDLASDAFLPNAMGTADISISNESVSHDSLPKYNSDTAVIQHTTSSTSSTSSALKKKKKASVGSIFHRKKLLLVDQWKKSAEAAEQEEKSRNPDSEELEGERMRLKEKNIQKWKEEQILSGAADSNANFIPVASDWWNVVQKNAQ